MSGLDFINTMVEGINIGGFGPDPIGIALALMIAVFVGRIEIKEEKYTNPAIVFLSSYAMLFSVKLATRLDLFTVVTIVLVVGVYLSEKIKVKR